MDFAGTSNDPPAASILRPADGDTVAAGTPVQFQGDGTDPEDGALPDASLVWTLGTGNAMTVTLPVGFSTITPTATDRYGATASASVQVYVYESFDAGLRSFSGDFGDVGDDGDDVGIKPDPRHHPHIAVQVPKSP